MGKPVLPSYEQFQRRSAEHLELAKGLLERLRADKGDAAAAGDLQRIFHRFAGMAEAFGHERAGALGKQGDSELLALQRANSAAEPDDVDGWSTLVDGIREDLARPPVVPEPDAGSTTIPPTVAPRPTV